MKRRKDRLKKLADFLSTEVKPRGKKKFDMNIWASGKRLGLREADCSTSGCALGWAAVRFKKSGFTLSDPFRDNYIYPAFKVGGKWRHGIFAASAFFGLTEEESKDVFMNATYFSNECYKTGGVKIQAVIKRLRALAA